MPKPDSDLALSLHRTKAQPCGGSRAACMRSVGGGGGRAVAGAGVVTPISERVSVCV